MTGSHEAARGDRGRRPRPGIWAGTGARDVDEALARRAAELARRHLPRGMDALHLAAVLSLAEGTSEAIVFATWGERQGAAARRETLATVPAR